MGKKDVGCIVTNLLRHCPQKYDLKLDKAGYCNIDELISALNKHGYKADKTMIEEIGKNDIWLIETSIPPEFIDFANIIINPKPY